MAHWIPINVEHTLRQRELRWPLLPLFRRMLTLHKSANICSINAVPLELIIIFHSDGWQQQQQKIGKENFTSIIAAPALTFSIDVNHYKRTTSKGASFGVLRFELCTIVFSSSFADEWTDIVMRQLRCFWIVREWRIVLHLFYRSLQYSTAWWNTSADELVLYHKKRVENSCKMSVYSDFTGCRSRRNAPTSPVWNMK